MPDKTSNGRTDAIFSPMMMPFGFEAFIEINRPALAAMAQMNGKVYDGIATMNKNWVAFVNRRLKEDLGMPKQLADCKTMNEMYGVCADFLQNAYADYQSEFEQMTKLGKTLADDTLQAMQARTEATPREQRSSN